MMAQVELSHAEYERRICAEIAEINSGIASLPGERRLALYAMIESDMDKLLDELEVELRTYRQSSAPVPVFQAAQAENR